MVILKDLLELTNSLIKIMCRRVTLSSFYMGTDNEKSMDCWHQSEI